MKCNCGFSLAYDLDFGSDIPDCLVCGNALEPTSEEWLSETGLGLISESRVEQQAMASSIAGLIRKGGTGIYEGGTGTGKTLAYLLPILLTNQSAVITTAKKTLQSQLLLTELPKLQNALSDDFEFAPAYGRSNYPCRKEAEKFLDEDDLAKINLLETDHRSSGMWSSADDLKIHLPIEAKEYNAEFCIGRTCEYWAGNCSYARAKRKLRDADVIVTNHWLLGYHLRLWLDPLTINGGLLPTFDVLVVDEAHKLHEGLRDAFTRTIKENHLKTIKEQLKSYSTGLSTAWQKMFANAKQHQQILNPDRAMVIAEVDTLLNKAELPFELRNKLATTRRLFLPYDNDDGNYITKVDGTTFELVPIEVSPFVRFLNQMCSTIIYTSATLALNGKFDIFKKTIGEDNPSVEKIYASPFNYSKQALLYINNTLPAPTRLDADVNSYRTQLADEIYELITAINGNAFVLFTARDEMTFVADYLRKTKLCKLPLLVQGKGTADQLLKKYKSTPNAVLLGLKSFWEGIDVQGEKLSLVIITKLPFPQNTDPIIEARRKKAGDKWFASVDLPEMMMDLRQGVGRLIRSKTDRGVIAILDSRLSSKSYKNRVLSALGIPNVTNNKEAVLKALRNLANSRK